MDRIKSISVTIAHSIGATENGYNRTEAIVSLYIVGD